MKWKPFLLAETKANSHPYTNQTKSRGGKVENISPIEKVVVVALINGARPHKSPPQNLCNKKMEVRSLLDSLVGVHARVLDT